LFQVNEEIGHRLRSMTAWLKNRPMILYCGALGAVNATDFLVRLASAVHARNPEICFVVIGRGNREERMRAEAQRLGILDRSFFMLGAKPKVELPQWLSACNIALALINGP